MSKWQNSTADPAGPRQVKDLNRAISALRSEGQTRTEITGVHGGESHEWHTQALMGPVRPEVTELDRGIAEKYGYTVTRANVRDITADYAAALPKARESRPVDDNRRTPEEDAEQNAAAAARAAAEQAEQDARRAVLDQVMAKAPAGAHALIVAELHEDASDPMTDYFSSRTLRTVAIGFRFGKREDFRQLRAAAAGFPETAHMADEGTLRAWNAERGMRPGFRDELEHRDNHSMGAGNYLSDHGGARFGSGWVVKSATFPCKWVHVTEDAIPDTPAASAQAASASADGLTVSPSSLGKPGVIELRFDGKPSEEIREALKRRAGFRWSKFSGCWYGPRAGYIAAGAPLPPLPESEPAPEMAAATA